MSQRDIICYQIDQTLQRMGYIFFDSLVRGTTDTPTSNITGYWILSIT